MILWERSFIYRNNNPKTLCLILKYNKIVEFDIFANAS